MLIIPLNSVPSQTFTVQLSNQQCDINIYQKSTGLYADLSINGTSIFNTMICLNSVGLVREAYQGFYGQLAFFDTIGSQDPDYTGLGSRYILTYWTPE
jgi:hypothetical protein